jgi:transposase
VPCRAARWRPGRGSAPGYLEQCRQLTAARAGNPWLAAGSQTVQQQALRDYARALAGFFAGTHGRPSWRKAGRDEGFRVTGQRGKHWDVRRLSRNWGQIKIPKAGWVRFRWSRDVPADARSFRVTRTGRAAGTSRSPSSPHRSRDRGPGRPWASTAALRSARPCPPGRCLLRPA